MPETPFTLQARLEPVTDEQYAVANDTAAIAT
jgi:hypothetical protein